MDERGGVSIEITIGSVCPRTRKENAASEEQRNGYRFNGENEREENESMDPFSKGCVRDSSKSKKDVRLCD
jgi:hypothetical protein